MGFWDSLWNGIKSVGTSIYNVVRKPIDFIASAGEGIKKIPIFGGAMSTLLSPVTGLAKSAQSGLDMVKDVAGVGSALGFQHGGMVPQKKYYQA